MFSKFFTENYKKILFIILIIVICIVIVFINNPKSKENNLENIKAIILEIDKEKQTVTVEGTDPDSVISEKCIITLEKNQIELENLSIGDNVILFIDSIQEGYPMTAKATTIQLEQKATTPKVYSAKNLWNARTEYVGNNSSVGKIISLLLVPDELIYDHFELFTSEQPYSIKIVYSTTTGILEKYDAENQLFNDIFIKNVLLLFALVDNVEDINLILTDGKREIDFSYNRESANYIVDEDVRNYNESANRIQELIDTSNIIQTKNNFTLEEAIHNAILENNNYAYNESGVVCENNIVLGTESISNAENIGEIESIIVYTVVYYKEYDLIDGKADLTKMPAGVRETVAITFDIGKNGEYILKEYWRPRDGSYNVIDIENKFPEEVFKKAQNTQQFVKEQEENIYQQLIEEDYIDPDFMITNIINDILQITDDSPDWLLSALQNKLTYYCDYMLIYAYSRFLEGGQNDEIGKIMENACRDILKQFDEDIDFNSETGQEWFDAYLEEVKSYQEKEGIEFVRDNMPKAYLLITI